MQCMFVRAYVCERGRPSVAAWPVTPELFVVHVTASEIKIKIKNKKRNLNEN